MRTGSRMSTAAPRARLALAGAGAVVALALIGVSCSDSNDTTALEDTTTTTMNPLLDQPAGPPSSAETEALIQTWTKMGFTEAQARCMVEELSEMSDQSDDSDPADDQSRVEQMMTTCGVNDEALQGATG